ncbi:MAG: DegV family protein [Ruminococcaceae bacterium]|nr:DegV family protein [Oscillospiraceae bacterium]
MSYTIVTDSSCNLTAKMIEDYGVEIISLKYFAGEKAFESYTKGVDPDFKAFYNMARKKEPLSTTLASPELCEQTFDRILAGGSDLIYIGFSSGLSGTYQVAHNVLEELKEKYPDRKIYDVDSLAASLGQGLLVHYAVNKKNEGATIEELHQWLMDNRLNLCHWFTVDDLFYLKRGGRVSGAAAVMGTVLSIKPVMHVDNNGKLIPKAKVIGRKRAIETLVSKMKETAINPAEQTIFISHGDCLEDAELLADLVKNELGVKEVFIHYIEPVIGCHAGPGTLALFFMGTQR